MTPNDPDNSAEGDLLVDTEINGIKVKSVLAIIKEEAFRLSLDEWANLLRPGG